MPLNLSTIRAVLLVLPLFSVQPVLAQDRPPNDQHFNAMQMGLTPESVHHRCFEQRNGAKDALHRLSASARSWLTEDAVYIITPEERCTFLHLETDEERDQFIEQFWYRRS